MTPRPSPDERPAPDGRGGPEDRRAAGGRASPGDRPTRPSTEEAASAVQRALLTCIGPAAAEQIALAQARLAWQEVVAEAGLSRGPMHSRLLSLRNGTARIEVSEGILAGELRLRAEALMWSVNRRMEGRPGASSRLRALTIIVGRGGGGRSL